MATEAEAIAAEIVVFKTPDGDPFSNDPRWNDSRVQEAWKAKDADFDPEEYDPEDQVQVEPEDEDDDEPYDKWTNDELRGELSGRGLSVEGKKLDMVARLEADDKGKA